ncbi:MAG: FHA domain-containing protein [Gemmatimonadales bacterium]
MGAPMMVEVLDAHGRVQQRIRVPARGLRIGRAFDNDLVLDDPYVDGHHLEIAIGPDGGLRFVDRGSVNGTWQGGARRPIPSGALAPGTELRIGRTSLRVADPTRPVPPARVDRRHANLANRLTGQTSTAVRYIVFGLVVFALQAYLEESETVTAATLATPLLGIALAFGVWAGLWSLIGRVAIHRSRFLQHFGWASLIALGSAAVGEGGSWLGFLAPSSEAPELLVGAADLGLGMLLLAGHLGLATEWNTRRRWGTALGVAALGLAIAALVSDLTEPSGGAPGRYATTLKPIGARLLPTSEPDRFFEAVGRLEEDATESVADDGSAER